MARSDRMSAVAAPFGGVAVGALATTHLPLGIALGTTLILAVSLLAPGAVLGFAWSGLGLLPGVIPAGAGLAVSAVLLGLALLCSGRGLAWTRLPVASLAPLAIFAGVLSVSFLFRPTAVATEQFLQALYGIALAITTAMICSRREYRIQFLFAMGALASLLSGAELLRVVAGGGVHAEIAAFGMNPIDLARLTGFGALAACWLSMEVKSRSLRVATYAAGVLAIAGTLATGSRGPFVALMVGAGYLLFVSRGFLRSRVTKTVMALVAIIATWWAAGVSDGRSTAGLTAEDGARVAAWQQAISTAMSEPFLGAGLGNYVGSSTAWTVLDFPHNVFLQVGAELGLLALVAFLIAGARSFVSGSAGARALILFSAVCISVSGNLGQSQIWWAALGLGFSAAVARSSERAVEPVQEKQVTVK